MSKLLEEIVELKGSEVGRLAESRIRKFKAAGKKTKEKIFQELCFCILTANFQAERSMKIQEEIGDGFITLPKPRLAKKLKSLGHRFPNTRAAYIVEARKHMSIDNAIPQVQQWLTWWIGDFGPRD